MKRRSRQSGPVLRFSLFLLALVGPAVASAQNIDDAAHRADRARTRQLNAAAGKVVDSRNRRNSDAQESYRERRADYEGRLEAWRRRVAACRGGDYAACDDR
jgi:hypothetical protein